MRIVVPTERHVELLSSSAARVETIASLDRRLFAALLPEQTVASAEVARLALARALEEDAGAQAALARARESGAGAWQRTVTSIEQALAVVREAGCAASVARIAEEGSDRARILSRALQRQDALLHEHRLVEAHGVQGELTHAIREATPAEVAEAAGDRELTARLIVSWTATRLAAWRALDEVLSRLGGRASIELPSFDEELDPSRTSGPLDRLSDEVASALDGPALSAPIEPRLGDLRFVTPPDEATTRRVSLAQATDALGQAWAVAREVVEALGRGAAPEAIAVAVPGHGEEATRAILAALGEAGVVIHDPRARPLDEAPLLAFAMHALAVADDGLAREATARLLRSRYADPTALSGLADERGARGALDRIARALASTPSVRGDGPVQSLERTVARSTVAARDRAQWGRPLPAIAAHAANVLVSAVSGRTRADHVARARALWSALDLPAKAAGGARELLAGATGTPEGVGHRELEAIAFDARAWEGLTLALEAYVIALTRLGMADARASNATFRAELMTVLGMTTTRLSAGRAGAVRLVSLAEIAGEPLELLIVADCNHGLVPEQAPLPPFFSPPLEARLTHLDARFPTGMTRANRGAADLALAASRARRFVLVHRSTSESGDILAPSPLFTWLASAPGATIAPRRAPSLIDPPLTEAQARLSQLARDAEGAVRLAPDAAERARRERLREAFFAGDRTARRSEEAGVLAPDAALHGVLVGETGGAGVPMAVTALERFATCAFQGYAAKVLGAREERASEETPDAREQGSIVHGALAAAFLATATLWAARPRDGATIRELALRAADAFLDRGTSSSGLRRLAKDDARRDVIRVLEWSLADERWDFLAAERPFGDGKPESWSAVTLEGDGSTLALRGSIDRVDDGHGAAAVRVIDYKLSESRAASATRSLGVLTFQLPVYARAAGEQRAARERTGVYLPTRVKGTLAPGTTKGHADAWARATADENGRPAFEAHALALVERVRAGTLTPSPQEPNACELCPFDGGCRKPRFVISAEHEDDLDR